MVKHVSPLERRAWLTPALLVQIIVLLVAMGTTYGMLANRLSNIEVAMATSQSRYDREVVPRSEHLEMNAVLEQRLQSITDRQIESQKQIESLQAKIDELLRRK